jgi:hypothetical protein
LVIICTRDRAAEVGEIKIEALEQSVASWNAAAHRARSSAGHAEKCRCFFEMGDI